MPLQNNGNERDVRIRPGAGLIYGADANLKGTIPPTRCMPAGVQESLSESRYTIIEPGGSHWKENLDWADLSNICPRGLDMRSVEKIIFQMVSCHFLPKAGHSDQADTLDPNLKGLVYSQNTLNTKIRIALNTTFDAATAGNLPAIIIKRGQQKFARLALGDRLTLDTTSSSDDKLHFARKAEGVHQLVCVSAVPGETEGLAFEMAEFFTCMSPLLRERIPFADFEVDGISELQLAEDLGNRSVAVVQLAYRYEYGWSLVLDQPVASAMQVSILQI